MDEFTSIACPHCNNPLHRTNIYARPTEEDPDEGIFYFFIVNEYRCMKCNHKYFQHEQWHWAPMDDEDNTGPVNKEKSKLLPVEDGEIKTETKGDIVLEKKHLRLIKGGRYGTG